MKDNQKVIRELRWLVDNQKYFVSASICIKLYILGISRDSYAKVIKLMQEWPRFSGNDEYPVPHPTLNPEEGYLTTRGIGMWSGEYGDNRRALCKWLADRLEEDILK